VVADELVAAMRAGRTSRVLELLAPDVVLVGDGGPDHHAARRPVVGVHRVSRFLSNLAAKARAATFEPRVVNAQPAYVVRSGDQVVTTLVVSVVDGRVGAVYSIVNPDKLTALDASPVQ
jgi:RNA polymerase sigma-70 factor (ECF subfamily)